MIIKCTNSKVALIEKLNKSYIFSISVRKDDGEGSCASQYDDSGDIFGELKAEVKAKEGTPHLLSPAIFRTCQMTSMKSTSAEEKVNALQVREKVDLDKILSDVMERSCDVSVGTEPAVPQST
jgi:hypothetical protein